MDSRTHLCQVGQIEAAEQRLRTDNCQQRDVHLHRDDGPYGEEIDQNMTSLYTFLESLGIYPHWRSLMENIEVRGRQAYEGPARGGDPLWRHSHPHFQQ